MSDLPDWIEPGQPATLIWYDAVEARPDGIRLYQVSGPILDTAPPSPYFMLVPVERGEFADRLYRQEVTLEELREFLGYCVVAHGWMNETFDVVSTRAEAPALPLLEAWRATAERPLVAYQTDLDAFLCDDVPVYVSPEAYAAAQQVAESFDTASVCAGCGEADDAGVFFWTLRRGQRVRVCFLIQNQGGTWTCRLHPFEFEAIAAPATAGPAGASRPD